MNRFWIILSIVILMFVGIFIAQKGNNKSTKFEGDARKITETDHVRGNKDAKVTLIEYADFQCPGCGSYFPILQSLESTHGDRVRFVFRHFPLIQIHPNAFSAARAAEAAGNQGKFFEMHDKLFQTQTTWGQATTNQQSLFEGYAMDLGLNIDNFRTDFASKATADRINLDSATGRDAFGVESTPTFILNGNKITNPQGLEAFTKLLDDELKKLEQ